MRDWIAFQIAGDSGQPLIFLHGMGGDAAFWRLQLDAFHDRFRAIAWDMPGYGDSPPPSEFTLSSLAAALELLLDRLKVETAHLVGHGLGGMIGLEFARTRPERARSLTLAATAAPTGRLEDARG